MALTFRSTISETFKIIGEDSDGSRRVAIATRIPGPQTKWDLQLTHPSGRTWVGSFQGHNVLDGLGEFMVRKETEYQQAKGRGHRPEQPAYDYNRAIPDDGSNPPPVHPYVKR